jgi:hypothetical protein
MSRLRLLYIFKWYFFNFMDATRKMYNFSVDAVSIFYYIKNKIDVKLSSFLLKSKKVLNYYFFVDFVHTKFLYMRQFFYMKLFDILF